MLEFVFVDNSSDTFLGLHAKKFKNGIGLLIIVWLIVSPISDVDQ